MTTETHKTHEQLAHDFHEALRALNTATIEVVDAGLSVDIEITEIHTIDCRYPVPSIRAKVMKEL